MQTLKLKGRHTTVYYKDPKIKALNEEIAKRLFLRDNPEMDIKELKRRKRDLLLRKSNQILIRARSLLGPRRRA